MYRLVAVAVVVASAAIGIPTATAGRHERVPRGMSVVTGSILAVGGHHRVGAPPLRLAGRVTISGHRVRRSALLRSPASLVYRFVVKPGTYIVATGCGGPVPRKTVRARPGHVERANLSCHIK